MIKTNLLLLIIFLFPVIGMAQDKEAVLDMKFDGKDSIKKVLISVTSEGKPAKEVEIKLFAKRLGGQLELGSSTTDESGVASFDFPLDLPGDIDKNIDVIAKLEENDIYMDNEIEGKVQWGIEVVRPSDTLERSMYAGRSRAPIYLFIIANGIIIGIWGTLCYIVVQLFRLKKLGTISEDNFL